MGEVGRRWRRILHDEALFGHYGGQVMFSVAAGGPGLVAVGAADGQNGGQAAAVWTSPDGVVWQRVAHDEAVFGGPGEQEMMSVAAGGPGLVAVGWDLSLGAGAVWVSADGFVWRRVPHDPQTFGDGAMWSVVAGGPGLVAVGWHNRGAPAVWVSPDGVVWQRVAHDAAVFGDGAMFSVAAGGPGLVAVGAADGQNGGQAAAVWTSTDGAVWQRVAHDATVFGGPGRAMNSVTAGGPGLVAVGWDLSLGAGAVWVSADGFVWRRVPHDPQTFGDGAMWSVAVGGPGLVAVGSDQAEYAPVPVVWVSSDGLVWQRTAHDEQTFGHGHHMYSVVAGGPGLVAVGNDVLGHLLGIAERALAGGPGLVAVGNDPARGPAVWVSP